MNLDEAAQATRDGKRRTSSLIC